MRISALPVTLVLLCQSGPAAAQDPQGVLNYLTRRQQERMLRRDIEEQQRFEDRQRQRYLDQQAAAYDRERCIQAGYRGPDIEQCVRDSALWRRGYRPGESVGAPPAVCMTDCLDGMCDTICR